MSFNRNCKKFKKFKKLSLGIVSLGLIVVIACSREVAGKVNFVFVESDVKNPPYAAKIMEQDITWDELHQGIASELYDAQMKVYEIQMERLRTLTIERFINSDKRKGNLSNEEYLEKYIAGDVKVTKDEIDAFSKERQIPAEHLNDEMKNRINEFLLKTKKVQEIEKWLAEKTKNNAISHHIWKPTRPTFNVDITDAPTWGNQNAKVTIVEFSDFQCPFCAKGSERLAEIKKKYGDKVQIAFRNFPLPFHNHAKGAANAALCAREQSSDKFWKYHDVLFAGQDALDQNGLLAKAKAVGLDVPKFTECNNTNKFLSQVENDMEIGKKLGVKSTPTFYVNGMLVSGAQPIEVFSELIDEELAK